MHAIGLSTTEGSVAPCTAPAYNKSSAVAVDAEMTAQKSPMVAAINLKSSTLYCHWLAGNPKSLQGRAESFLPTYCSTDFSFADPGCHHWTLLSCHLSFHSSSSCLHSKLVKCRPRLLRSCLQWQTGLLPKTSD